MNDNKVWDYRVVRKEYDCESGERYSVQEIYYDDETGEPMAQTVDLQVEGDTITEIRTRLEKMINCLGQPVLDESDITSKSDRYEAKGYTKEHTKQWLDWSDKINKDDNYEGPQYLNRKWIYESPDGGNTIYRREFGKDERK